MIHERTHTQHWQALRSYESPPRLAMGLTIR